MSAVGVDVFNVYGHLAIVGIADSKVVTDIRPCESCGADSKLTNVVVAFIAGLKEVAVSTVSSSYSGEGDAAA